MNISPITKRALPLVTSAAIGLGALASCSSGNKTNEYPTYKEEIAKLDNTLDSLKLAKNEGKIGFLNYYSQSKNVIETAKFNQAHKKFPGDSYLLFGLVSAGLGLLGVFDVALRKTAWSYYNSDTKDKLSLTLILTGLGLAGCAMFKNYNYNNEHVSKYEEYKKQKTDELNQEKYQYFDTKDLQFKEEFEMLNK